jgi:hypothetical protein
MQVNRDGRMFQGKVPVAHIVWNSNNPDDIIEKGYEIHHIDGDRSNDSIDNLVKLSHKEHNQLHKSKDKNVVDKVKEKIAKVKGKDVIVVDKDKVNKIKGNDKVDSKQKTNRVDKEEVDSKQKVNKVVVEHLYSNKNPAPDPSLLPGPVYPSLPDKSDSAAGKVKRLGNELIAKALMANNGKISKTAQSLHVSHWSLKQYMNKNPELLKLMVTGKEAELDFVEDKFMDAVKCGNLSAMIFYLKCQGRSRGWIEKQEDAKANKPNVTFKYTLVMPNQKRKVIDMGTIEATETTK